MTGRPTVVYVGYMSPDDMHDGFVYRYRHLCDTVESTCELIVVPPPTMCYRPALTGDGVGGRVRQFRRLAGHYVVGPPLTHEEVEFKHWLRELSPDLIVLPAYLGTGPARTLTDIAPTLFLLEESLLTSPEMRSRSPLKRVTARTRDRFERSWAAPPSAAIVVNNRERRWARRLYPRTRVETLRLTIDLDYWAEPVEPSSESLDVLCVGAMSERRNADGLALIVDELRRFGDAAPVVHLASSYEPHPVLTPSIQEGRVRFLGRVPDVRPLYRSAMCCLVPSFVVPGTKTTILQGWATGCPVVTTTEGAASVETVDGRALLAGATPADVAKRIVRLRHDAQTRVKISVEGGEVVRSMFGPDVIGRELQVLLGQVMTAPLLRRRRFGDFVVGALVR